MNIYRLQSVEELELLQNRIKSRSKDIKVHESVVPPSRVTSLERLLRETPQLPPDKPIKTAPRKPQKGSRSTFGPIKLPPVTQSALEAEFLLQVRSLKQALPKLQYQPFQDRKFRLDFAWPDRKVAVMVQGNVHRIKDKFYRDCELFCLLTVAGWRFLPISRRQVKS